MTSDPLKGAFPKKALFGALFLLLASCSPTAPRADAQAAPSPAEEAAPAPSEPVLLDGNLSAKKLAKIAEEQRGEGNWDMSAEAWRLAVLQEIRAGRNKFKKSGELPPKAKELLEGYERALLSVSSVERYSESDWPGDFSVEEFVEGYPEDSLAEKPIDTGLLLDGIDLPVELNERVWREIRYYTEVVPGFTERSLGRKAAYDDMVREALDSAGLPLSLAWLAFVESGYVVSALSSAKANGIWQFMPATARHYGLTVDWWLDERRDPEKSTRAALRYLATLHAEFDDWLLAMAAYNCGEGRVRRAIREQGTRDFWELSLPEETMHYVPRILAAAVIGRQHEHWDFEPVPQTLRAADTMTVDHPVPLSTVAEIVKTKEDTLLALNPTLVRWTTPPSAKKFLLRLPEGTRETFAAGWAKLDKSKLVRWQHHKVKSGENLSVIAARYGVSVSALQSANRLKNSRLRVGQDLMIPDPSNGKAVYSEPAGRGKGGAAETKSARGTITVRAGDSYYSLARTFNVTVEELKAANGATDNNLRVGQKLKLPGGSRGPSDPNSTYTVRKGDNLYAIAKTFGVSVADLKEWNRLDDKAQIFPGDRLAVAKPGSAKKPEAAKKAEPKKTEAKPSEPKKAEPKTAGSKKSEVWYTVRAGDNLWDISRRNNTTVDQLLKWNEKAKDGIRPGDRLKVGER